METVPVCESTTEVLVIDGEQSTDGATSSAPVLRLRLKKAKTDRKVAWRAGTVDNEDMGRKKSKCCCIYKKPVNFGESSSSDDEECEHCFGHPEKRLKNRNHNQSSSSIQHNNDPVNVSNLNENEDELPKSNDEKSQLINDVSQPMNKVH